MQPNVETVDTFLRDLQDRICAALEKADGGNLSPVTRE
jgi:coproporphyrinogen III oxidase